jgi:NAD(P)-dependent dehydrogenase (short-subunit alcohol dehydrogenase family)
MTSSTSGKGCAIVTGSSQGIGHSIALHLARDGYAIVVNDLPFKQAAIDNVVAEIKTVGGRAIGVPGDISDEQVVKNVIQRGVQELGPLAVVRPYYSTSLKL